MAKVFISYRHINAESAEPLFEGLVKRFGSTNVFFDSSAIEPGEVFPEKIRCALEAATVVLVVIGRGWGDIRDGQGKFRLSDPQDWVRTEIRLALKLGKRIIPVVLRGAAMPPREELPEDIREIALLSWHQLQNFNADIARLCNIIEPRFSVAEPAAVMALAAGTAFSERQAVRGEQQRTCRVEGYEVGSIELPPVIAEIGPMSLYYALLVLGGLVAARDRTGWRLEEMLRVAGCAAIGVALSQFVVVGATASLGPNHFWVQVLQVGLWFAGISIGTAYGFRQYSLIENFDSRRASFICATVICMALLGSFMQNAYIKIDAFKLGEVNPRTLLWAPILLGTSIVWFRFLRRGRSARWSDLAKLLIPVLAAMVAADVLVSVPTPIFSPVGGDDQSLVRACVMRFAHTRQTFGNALFFALVAGVGSWRLNSFARDDEQG
ncbi:toll/interleukin-1 receptor domain-containing protein [Variovorax rhizosphaerae]|uniref:Toll/interleukin-1 receptor domain-containing protein n=1 Tax=Variovorax rhizosphaerae TaxID=1836200 RepID=A0ABU8WMU9_9BURK